MADGEKATIPVDLGELQTMCSSLLTRLIAQGHDFVALTHDFYWSIPADARRDPYHEPTELTLGQVTDDLDRLRGLVADRDDYVPPNALAWLAALLSSVADQLGQ